MPRQAASTSSASTPTIMAVLCSRAPSISISWLRLTSMARTRCVSIVSTWMPIASLGSTRRTLLRSSGHAISSAYAARPSSVAVLSRALILCSQAMFLWVQACHHRLPWSPALPLRSMICLTRTRSTSSSWLRSVRAPSITIAV